MDNVVIEDTVDGYVLKLQTLGREIIFRWDRTLLLVDLHRVSGWRAVVGGEDTVGGRWDDVGEFEDTIGGKGHLWWENTVVGVL